MFLTNEQKYEYSKAMLIKLLNINLITPFEFSEIIRALKSIYFKDKAPKSTK